MASGEYAEMLEIPVSSCEMVIGQKKKKKKNARKSAIKKTNQRLCENAMQSQAQTSLLSDAEEVNEVYCECEQKPEKKKGFDIITAQKIAIFVLLAAIFVTNIFWEDSGINTLIKSVFASEKQVIDERDYSKFTLKLPSTRVSTVEDGIITVSGDGAVYCPTKGVVDAVAENDGKYTMTIKHSDVFKTIIRGADMTYFEVGDTVYGEVPVCYSAGGDVQVLLYNDNSLMTDYSIADGSFVWQNLS